jgi:ABC-type Fe3+-hydroxamate transport system substrate-binding protein
MSENKANILQQIKSILTNVKFDAQPISEESAPIELMKVTDASGNEYEVEALEIGKVMTMGGVPVPAGEYIVAEGATVVTVGEGGIITEISEAASEMPEEEVVAEVAHLSIEKVEQMIADAAKQMEVKYNKQIDDLQQSISQSFASTKQAIEVLADMPTAEPIHVEHNKINKSDKQARRELLGEAFTNFLKK